MELSFQMFSFRAPKEWMDAEQTMHSNPRITVGPVVYTRRHQPVFGALMPWFQESGNVAAAEVAGATGSAS